MILFLVLLFQALMLLLSGTLGQVALLVSVVITLLIFIGTFRYGAGKYVEPQEGMSWLMEGLAKEAKKANIKMPKLYILDDYIPNAYSFRNIVVLSLGLFEVLDREGILAVIAHEVGHIKNHDGLVFPLMAYGRVFMIVTFLMILPIHRSSYFVPISLLLVVLYEWDRAKFLRSREFKADDVAVTLLDNPLSLKEALEELEYYDDLMTKVRHQALPGIEPSIKREEAEAKGGCGKGERQYWTPTVFSFPTHPTYSERIRHIITLVESEMLQ